MTTTTQINRTDGFALPDQRNATTSEFSRPERAGVRESRRDPLSRKARASGSRERAFDHDSDPDRESDSRSSGIDHRDTGNGMLNSSLVASRWKIAWRHIIVRLLSKLPGTRFKSTLVRRLLGVRMGRDVGFAYGSMLDPYDPTMISFGDNVIVGYEAKIFVHMFTLSRQRIRPVRVGNDVIIGACSIIAPGVTIGDGASIAPGTIVNRDVPAGAMAMGNPMKVRRRSAAAEK